MPKKSLFFLFLIFITTAASAQQIQYPQLVQRSERPEIFIDHFVLPVDSSSSTLVFNFRFNYDFIPFRKIPAGGSFNAPESAEFYSTIRLNSEVFEGPLKKRNGAASTASRDIWSDTLYAADFEETQSRNHYASGLLTIPLAPGKYHFMLQLSMLQERNERSTQRRNVTIPNAFNSKKGEILLIEEVHETANGQILQLLNMEDNVPFGKDFTALIRIPDYKENTAYTVQVNRAQASRKDTTKGNMVFEEQLQPANIYVHSALDIFSKNEPSLLLEKGDAPFTYAIVSIPASRFENALYALSLTEGEADNTIAKTHFRSYWADMPASLYSLDIAIEHLKYIVSEKELNRINKGNKKEREKKFREFWNEKDPSPNTVYNELMAEYYRRIDYAFREFGSQENPMGHENDQGEVYIKFGPPEEKERVFPPDGKTREIWKYPNRTFVFEATTGFGDFKLISTR